MGQVRAGASQPQGQSGGPRGQLSSLRGPEGWKGQAPPPPAPRTPPACVVCGTATIGCPAQCNSLVAQHLIGAVQVVLHNVKECGVVIRPHKVAAGVGDGLHGLTPTGQLLWIAGGGKGGAAASHRLTPARIEWNECYTTSLPLASLKAHGDDGTGNGSLRQALHTCAQPVERAATHSPASPHAALTLTCSVYFSPPTVSSVLQQADVCTALVRAERGSAQRRRSRERLPECRP